MLAAFSCTREIELEVIPVETSEEATQAKVYTLAVHAEKGDAETKALDLSSDGKTLTASWKEGEEVDLYKGDDKIGTIVINGGTIYAQGTYSERHDESGQYVDHYYFDGRGIGSGGEGKVGTVTINGGTITAVSYRGRHWDQGGAFDKSGLTLASHLKVRGGDDESSATEATTLEGRYDKCYHDKWVRIEP